MRKAAPTDVRGRIREILADPSNSLIPRVPDAGRTCDGLTVMHNGLKVHAMGSFYLRALAANRGCHEPQEEYLFQEVLKHIRPGATMVELGAYWAFYSLWFAKAIPDAKCFMVEPDKQNLEIGRRNFATNGAEGTFIQDRVGQGYLRVDQFLDERKISFLDLLHADVQCAELEMLRDAEESLRAGRIGYLFLGTHGQDLHYRCKEFLESRDYMILAHADWFDGTFCQDGVLLARSRRLSGMAPVELPLRSPHRPYEIGSSDETLDTLMARANSRQSAFRRLARWFRNLVPQSLEPASGNR